MIYIRMYGTLPVILPVVLFLRFLAGQEHFLRGLLGKLQLLRNVGERVGRRLQYRRSTTKNE